MTITRFIKALILTGALLTAPLAHAGDRCGLTEDRTLLVWNSSSAESQAVRDLYVAAHPGVREFDLDLSYGVLSIARSTYLTTIRQPIKDYLTNNTTTDGTPLAEHIICIVTTRGVPARIRGINERTTFPISTWSSVESELTLLHQDLEQPNMDDGGVRFSGVIDNPYHRRRNDPISSYDRSQITVEREFDLLITGAQSIVGLTPGDIYLVCRIDSAPGPTTTELEEIEALIDRSASLSFKPSQVQALLDEYACTDQLDDDRYGPDIGSNDEDFERVVDVMTDLGVTSTYDATFNFIEYSELSDTSKPLIFFGTYGENHMASGCGADPPGEGTYIELYPNIHPAALFQSIESFNGNSILTGTNRQGQGNAMDFFPMGGSFTIAHVAEPYSFSISDSEIVMENLYQHGLTFAEAAYASLPVLSWQHIPLGDPLARVLVLPEVPGDINGDGIVDAADLGLLISAFGTSAVAPDLNGDCAVDAADLGLLIENFGN